ncbi:MAG: hypothetical protein JZU63_12080, partial [Rhodoferax sp.]|nr:hypothetical protein [Rhodoferax sp.]
ISSLGGLTIGKAGNSTAVTLSAAITLNGNVLVNGPTKLYANITTGGTQEYTGDVTISDNIVSLSTMGNSSAGNSITFGGNVNGLSANAQSLYLLSGSGAIDVAGSVGNTTALNYFGLGGTGAYVASSATNFSYTGALQTFTPSATGFYLVEVWGAQGANGSTGVGGLGGYAQGILSLSSGTAIKVYVGGAGAKSSSYSSYGTGGWNGGGTGSPYTSGGGGATDIRVSGTALTDRVLVAGGGGGASYYDANGGAGGGLIGSSGGSTNPWTLGGTGGTQSAGGAGAGNYPGTAGSLGVGGAAGVTPNSNYAWSGGGGGGYYGGAGGAGNTYNDNMGRGAGGGGGSSYVGGVALGTSTAGLRSGNGYATISVATETYTAGTQTGAVTIG